MSEGLKIGFITDKSAPVYFGGYEVRVFELANKLAELGHEVNVYTTSPNDFQTKSGVRFFNSFPGYFQQGKSGKRSLVHSSIYSFMLSGNPMGSWKPDYLIIEAIPYLHLLTMKRWVSKLNSVKILDVPEAWHNYSYLNNGLAPVSRRLISSLLSMGISFSDKVMAISRATAESLANNYGVPEDKILHVPCGVDIESLSHALYSMDDLEDIDKEYDFVTVGRLVNIKRQSDFIDALALLKVTYGWKGRAALIGSGPLAEVLKIRAAKLGLTDNLIFKGFVSEEEKNRTLASAKIFVLPSEREGFSIATLEAMAFGLPVIVAQPSAREVFGMSEFVTDKKNGLLYPVGDIGRLAASMHVLLDSDEFISAFGSYGKSVADRYDWRALASGFESMLDNVVNPQMHKVERNGYASALQPHV